MGFKTVVLAAGKGTRFKSELPKVLHPILGKPMLWYVVKAALEAGSEEVIVVVGHKRELVEEFLRENFPQVKTVYQSRQLGTGHAVAQCRELLENYSGKVVVLNGDTPLVRPEDIKAVASTPGDMVVLTAKTEDPTGYGRVVRDGNAVLKIVEEKDATPEERLITEINTGIYAFSAEPLFRALEQIDNNNAQGEYYLPDVLKVFQKEGLSVVPVLTSDFESVMGVNNRHQLAAAESVMRDRIVKELQLSGVTVHNPQTVYVEPDVTVEPDVELFGPLYLRGKTVIKKGTVVGPFCDIRDSFIGEGCTVESHCWMSGATLKGGASCGPFSRLREGTVLEGGSRVGSFVETKKAHLKEGAKANHLTYLGDCTVGENTNVGAGTITCNYDGFAKWRTEIGRNVFVGSNTLFIAPVKVGDGAITAAGSVITRDVPDNALAVARSKQVNYPGKAESVREKARKRAEEARGDNPRQNS
ncbi:bifunctional UDP-N-acetylglucosamine diphosphorylase/glucosamine-1-phosphate N-acetyltransferase GlmU [Thermovibrio ammonificans]